MLPPAVVPNIHELSIEKAGDATHVVGGTSMWIYKDSAHVKCTCKDENCGFKMSQFEKVSCNYCLYIYFYTTYV